MGERAGDRTSVSLPLAPGERIYGFGLQMSGVERRGVFHLRVDHYAGGHDRLHAPTPLYVSNRGYAVFFNTTRPIDVYVGTGNRLADPQIPLFPSGTTNLASVSADAPYEVRLFGLGPWKGRLYEDDGTSFAHEKGEYGLFEVSVDADHRASAASVGGERKATMRGFSPVRFLSAL